MLDVCMHSRACVHAFVCVCVRVRVCVLSCVRALMRACVRAMNLSGASNNREIKTRPLHVPLQPINVVQRIPVLLVSLPVPLLNPLHGHGHAPPVYQGLVVGGGFRLSDVCEVLLGFYDFLVLLVNELLEGLDSQPQRSARVWPAREECELFDFLSLVRSGLDHITNKSGFLGEEGVVIAARSTP